MDQSVQVSGGLLNRLSHVIVAVEIEDVSDQVEGILVVLDIGIKTRKVESVGEVVFVDLTEVLVAPGGDELGGTELAKRHTVLINDKVRQK